MRRFISITKAAQLASVSVKEVQEKIDNKMLASTRGQIHIDDLVDCYPKVHIEEIDMVTLVEKIKEESFVVGGAKQSSKMTYSELDQELQKQKANVEYYHERSQKFEDMLMHLRHNLEDFQRKWNSQKIHGLIHWMDKKLEEIRRND